jgi:hypothetical protein
MRGCQSSSVLSGSSCAHRLLRPQLMSDYMRHIVVRIRRKAAGRSGVRTVNRVCCAQGERAYLRLLCDALSCLVNESDGGTHPLRPAASKLTSPWFCLQHMLRSQGDATVPWVA